MLEGETGFLRFFGRLRCHSRGLTKAHEFRHFSEYGTLFVELGVGQVLLLALSCRFYGLETPVMP